MAIVLNSGNILPTVKISTAQELTVGAASVQSSTIGTSGRTPNIVIRIVSTTACRILTGSNPTAVATSALLPANVVEFTEITPGDKIAVIQESAGGKLSIAECIL